MTFAKFRLGGAVAVFLTASAVATSAGAQSTTTPVSECSTSSGNVTTTSTGVSCAAGGAAAVTGVTTAIGGAVASSISGAVAVRASGAFSAPSSGASGQGAADPIGVWADATFSRFKDDTGAVDSDGSAFIGTVGADYRVGNALVGAAVSFESVEATGEPVIGGVAGALDFEQSAVTIAPYAAYQFSETFSGSVAGGVTFGEARIDTTPAGGTSAKGDPGVFRYFVSGSANANTVVDNFTLGASASILYLESTIDSYTDSAGVANAESESELGRLGVGARVGYLAPYRDVTLEPYAIVKYEYDFTRTNVDVEAGQAAHPNDDHAVRLGGGLAMYSSDYGTGSIEGEYMLGKENQNESRVSLTYRLGF